jgi:hypothetical protein
VFFKIVSKVRNWPVYFVQKFFNVTVVYRLRGKGGGFSVGPATVGR